jgi:mono/diheme cytochrome c family protein
MAQRALIALTAVLAVSTSALAADSDAPPTFSKDVSRILQQKCQQCHQPNSIAPMSLITYQESRPWARSIKDRVVARQMPPWHIDPSVGVQHFKNDMSLSQDQIDTIVRWVDGGAVQGDPKDMPPAKPIQTDNQWQGVRDGFGEPDLVVKSSEYTMPAKHQDVWFRPTSDIPITEPRWVKMVEIRPSNLNARKILHHSIAYIILNPDS